MPNPKKENVVVPPKQTTVKPMGLKNAIGLGKGAEVAIGLTPDEKVNEPPSGKYKHNSPAKPL